MSVQLACTKVNLSTTGDDLLQPLWAKMSSYGSVTIWLHELRRGNRDAADPIWVRYFHRLHGLAQNLLGDRVLATVDAEDVAIIAFTGFCQDFEKGRFPDLVRRDELWPLLARCTVNRVIDQTRKESAQKRSATVDEVEIGEIPDQDHPPDMKVLMAEECRRLLDLLDDQELVEVALLKLDGWSNTRIASELNYSRRTIQRMLLVIRTRWRHELSLEDGIA